MVVGCNAYPDFSGRKEGVSNMGPIHPALETLLFFSVANTSNHMATDAASLPHSPPDAD